MSRRRGRRLRPDLLGVTLFVAVLAMGVALYDTAGIGPVVLALVVVAILVALGGSRRRSRRATWGR